MDEIGGAEALIRREDGAAAEGVGAGRKVVAVAGSIQRAGAGAGEE